MSTTKTELLNDPADCQWLRETHLKGVSGLPDFKSYVLYGNEDAPERVDLYLTEEPKLGDYVHSIRFLSGPPASYTAHKPTTGPFPGYTPINLDDMDAGYRSQLGRVYSNLAVYCEAMTKAFTLRATGRIPEAQRVEAECEAIYQSLPAWAKW